MEKPNTDEHDMQVENVDILSGKEGPLGADLVDEPSQHIHGKTIILLLVSISDLFSTHPYEY